MTVLAPIAVNVQPVPDRFTAYWRSACCAAGYDRFTLKLQQLVTLAGGSTVQQITAPIPFPNRVYCCAFPAGAMVLVNGTTNPAQYLASALGAVAQATAGWQGKVNSFFATAALIFAARLAPILQALNPASVVYVGHSLGGAVAALLASQPQAFPVAGCWTIGQPRTGTAAWATTFPVPYERWTTPGDPVPLLPPSRNPLIDLTLAPIWPFLPDSYEHAGTRRHVWPDGVINRSTDAPSWNDASDYLLGVALGESGWFGAHATTTYG